MIRSRLLLLGAAVSALAVADAASAQISREGGARIQNATARSEVSLDPLDLQGSLDGTPFIVPMSSVSLSGRTRPVMMVRQKGSTVGIWDMAERENGTYLVRFTLSWVNEPSQMRLRMGGPQGAALGTCALAQDLSYNAVEQHCEAAVNHTDGKLHVILEFDSGHQAEVSRITVRRLL